MAQPSYFRRSGIGKSNLPARHSSSHMRFFKMGSVAVMSPDMTNKPPIEEPKMTASQLANRIALSQLIEFDMESAEQLATPPAEMFVHFDDADLNLLAGDDDLDLTQAEEECAFFNQMNKMRGNREVRRHLRDW